MKQHGGKILRSVLLLILKLTVRHQMTLSGCECSTVSPHPRALWCHHSHLQDPRKTKNICQATATGLRQECWIKQPLLLNLLTCGQEGRGGIKGHAGNRSSVNGLPRASTPSLPPVPLLQQQSSASCYQQLWWDGEHKTTHVINLHLLT